MCAHCVWSEYVCILFYHIITVKLFQYLLSLLQLALHFQVKLFTYVTKNLIDLLRIVCKLKLVSELLYNCSAEKRISPFLFF